MHCRGRRLVLLGSDRGSERVKGMARANLRICSRINSSIASATTVDLLMRAI
jgi:hypothetical protein